ncbi:hypothetical protein JQ632_20890 [Bradyrhizobium liaoningense]|nr:hypothetical protein [Bradyrhizobium liaoningense]
MASKVATRTIAHLENGGRIPHDRTLNEFLMEDDDAAVGVGIRVRQPKLHPSILSAREERAEESGLPAIGKRKPVKTKG